MVAKVTWKGGMEFTGDTHSGFSLHLSASTQVGGAENGFRPMELMALGVAGCAAMDVISILAKKRQDITDFEVLIHPEFADQHPYVWTKIHMEYIVTGKAVESKAIERAIELSSTKYCPAQNMLDDSIEILSTFKIIEANTMAA